MSTIVATKEPLLRWGTTSPTIVEGFLRSNRLNVYHEFMTLAFLDHFVKHDETSTEPWNNDKEIKCKVDFVNKCLEENIKLERISLYHLTECLKGSMIMQRSNLSE